MASLLEVDHLWQKYKHGHRWRTERRDERWALKDISFRADGGDMLGVIGANGSGKTTLLRSIAGVLRPDRGRVSVTGRVCSVTDLAPGLDRDCSGREQMLVTGVLYGLSRSQVSSREDDILALSGLDPDVLDEPLRTYSAGMVLRLMVAVALNSLPTVALLDDVLAVGDEDFVSRVLGRLETLRHESGLAVIASHDLGLVSSHCDRVILLSQGALEFSGAPTAAMAFSRRRPVA